MVTIKSRRLIVLRKEEEKTMCGRYTIKPETIEEIKQIVFIEDSILLQEKEREVYPSEEAMILYAKEDQLAVKKMLWGFVSYHKKGLIINARSETIAQRPMFRDSVQNRRCVIVASQFYEWNMQKEKIAFYRKDSKVLYLAGIYNEIEGNERFVIITTKANTSVEQIHDRMPLIIEKEQLEKWIFDKEAAKAILQQTPILLEQKQEYKQQNFFS